jgi:hypothetical protein
MLPIRRLLRVLVPFWPLLLGCVALGAAVYVLIHSG